MYLRRIEYTILLACALLHTPAYRSDDLDLIRSNPICSNLIGSHYIWYLITDHNLIRSDREHLIWSGFNLIKSFHHWRDLTLDLMADLIRSNYIRFSLLSGTYQVEWDAIRFDQIGLYLIRCKLFFLD